MVERKVVITTAMALVTLLAFITHNRATATQVTTTTRLDRRIPVLLVQGYYDTCPRAEPVRLFETKNYWVSICKGDDDRLFYRGVRKANRNQSINVANVKVLDDYTYVAQNSKTEYRINKRTLVVVQDDQVILKEKVICVK